MWLLKSFNMMSFFSFHERIIIFEKSWILYIPILHVQSLVFIRQIFCLVIELFRFFCYSQIEYCMISFHGGKAICYRQIALLPWKELCIVISKHSWRTWLLKYFLQDRNPLAMCNSLLCCCIFNLAESITVHVVVTREHHTSPKV